MGDMNALAHAQEAHERIIEPALCRARLRLMRYGRPLPSGPVLAGAYVGDLAVVCAGDAADQAAAAALVADAEGCYASAKACVQANNVSGADRATI